MFRLTQNDCQDLMKHTSGLVDKYSLAECLQDMMSEAKIEGNF